VDDSLEWTPTWSVNDANFNGVDDSLEWTPTWSVNDANFNGVDDSLEWTPTWSVNDANFNGVDDSLEWSQTWPVNDANFNGVDDSLEWSQTWPVNDANANGVDDAFEVPAWPVNDANFNGVDDASEWSQTWPVNDADANGVDDAFEVPAWPVNDANFNGVDDALEWAPTGALPSAVQSVLDATALPSTAAAPWETAPADDLSAAIAFAQHVANNPSAHPVLREYAGLNDVVDAIAGPAAIAEIVGVPFEPGMTLDDIALITAVRGPLSAETSVPVEQFSLKSGTGLQLNPFFGSSAAGLTLNGLDDWVDDLVTRAAARGDFRPGAGGFEPLMQGIDVRTQVGTDYHRWLQTIWTSNAISAATSPF
jgi:hypothetical protein